MRLAHWAAACLLAIPTTAYARPTPTPRPTQVWVDAAVGLESLAGLSARQYNRYTATKFTCTPAPDDDASCQPVRCPTTSMCLTIRWGQFADDSQDARLVPVMCSGGCYRAAVIEINPEGPMHSDFGSWTPYHKLRLMMVHFGLFTGLTAQPTCVSWMSAVTCPADGFTPAEAAHLAGW